MAHACNPSYSGGREQKNHGLKPDQAKTIHKTTAGGVAQDEGPEFKPSLTKKKKKHSILCIVEYAIV
jgi:hypothetical protein